MLITKEMLERVQEKAKKRPPLTPEEKARNEALGKKLLSLSPEERREMVKRAAEEDIKYLL